MTDPETADRSYIEPITWDMVARIIEREKPEALLPTPHFGAADSAGGSNGLI